MFELQEWSNYRMYGEDYRLQIVAKYKFYNKIYYAVYNYFMIRDKYTQQIIEKKLIMDFTSKLKKVKVVSLIFDCGGD